MHCGVDEEEGGDLVRERAVDEAEVLIGNEGKKGGGDAAVIELLI